LLPSAAHGLLTPIIFSAVADALQWMMLEEGGSWVGYYQDGFITVGPASTEECQRGKDRHISPPRDGMISLL